MTAFIIGTGRCGTTILAQMLNAHSAICVPHELQILFEYSHNGERLYEVFASGKNERFNASDYINLIEERCPKKFDIYFDYRSFFKRQRYPIRDLKFLVNSLFVEIAREKGKLYLVEQTPWYGQRLDILDALFPQAKYIHIVRDGRDVAASYVETPWWYDDLASNLDRWAHESMNIAESAKYLSSEEQMLLIRYEDLVLNSEKYLRRICDHLGIEFEQNMLNQDFYENYTIYRKNGIGHARPSAALERWRKHREVPLFSSRVFAWRGVKQHEFENMSEHANKALRHFGYDEIDREY